MTRDPRIDPRKGERLYQEQPQRPGDKECMRVRVALSLDDWVTWFDQDGNETFEDIDTWRRWAKGATVLHVAEEGA